MPEEAVAAEVEVAKLYLDSVEPGDPGVESQIVHVGQVHPERAEMKPGAPPPELAYPHDAAWPDDAQLVGDLEEEWLLARIVFIGCGNALCGDGRAEQQHGANNRD